MRGRSLILITLVALALAFGTAEAQYWFQTGAVASGSSDYNTGASVSIQSITPQAPTSGSLGFWVGENLPNGAFLQTGYVIENQTAVYPSYCSPSGCTQSEFLKAGDAEWFYEYFLPNTTDTFLGAYGPDGSAGQNGAWNSYGFQSAGNRWYFLFDGNVVGSVDLGVPQSGTGTPVAFAELANTSGASSLILPVAFENFSLNREGKSYPITKAYAYIGYGQGSLLNLKNPYGIKVPSGRADAFEVGSGLPQPNNGTVLWNSGYYLKVVSAYGNLSNVHEYQAGVPVAISAPSAVRLGDGSMAVFEGWLGAGAGSYTGTDENTTLIMDGNMTETANWKLEYNVTIESSYGTAVGGGWYAAGSNASISLSNVSRDSGVVFEGWSNGETQKNFSVQVTAPMNITASFDFVTSITGVDAYGNPLRLSSVTVDGQTHNTTFLLSQGRHTVGQVQYDGTDMNVSDTINVTAPSAYRVSLPVFDVQIQSQDLLGLPVEASATVSFPNGTSESFTSSPDGLITIYDVPYGYAAAKVTSLGQTDSVMASDGIVQRALFISTYEIGAVIAIAAVTAIVYAFGRRHLKRPMEPTTERAKS